MDSIKCRHCVGSFDASRDTCPHCGNPNEKPTKEQMRAWTKYDDVQDGAKEGARRSKNCPHGCEFYFVDIHLPGNVTKITTLTRCALNWFRAEYPEDENMRVSFEKAPKG